MNENLVKIAEYIVDREIINKCNDEERELRKEDVEGIVQEILRGNGIECKTKISEKWTPADKYGQSKYQIIAEVYINKCNYEKAKKLIFDI